MTTLGPMRRGPQPHREAERDPVLAELFPRFWPAPAPSGLLVFTCFSFLLFFPIAAVKVWMQSKNNYQLLSSGPLPLGHNVVVVEAGRRLAYRLLSSPLKAMYLSYHPKDFLREPFPPRGGKQNKREEFEFE